MPCFIKSMNSEFKIIGMPVDEFPMINSVTEESDFIEFDRSLDDTEGNEYKISEDITDQFDDPDHRIIIYNAVDIPKPTGNGIAPSVEPWESENHDVPIG